MAYTLPTFKSSRQAYFEGLRSTYEKHLDKQQIAKQQSTSPDQQQPSQYEGPLLSESSYGGYGRKPSLKKQVRFQVYEAKNLVSIQDMRKQKFEEIERFSKERILQQTIVDQFQQHKSSIESQQQVNVTRVHDSSLNQRDLSNEGAYSLERAPSNPFLQRNTPSPHQQSSGYLKMPQGHRWDRIEYSPQNPMSSQRS